MNFGIANKCGYDDFRFVTDPPPTCLLRHLARLPVPWGRDLIGGANIDENLGPVLCVSSFDNKTAGG